MDRLSENMEILKNQSVFDSKIADDWVQPDASEYLEPESQKQQKKDSKNIFPVENFQEGMFDDILKDMQMVSHTDIQRLKEQDSQARKQSEKSFFTGKIRSILSKDKKADGSKEDVEFIRSLSEVPAEALSDLEVEDRARLEVVKYRNLSSLLLKENKTGGDSSEMKEIKKAVTDIENAMTEVKNYTPENIEDLIGKYKIAIAHCKYYVKVKNPDTSVGIERKEMVENTLDRLNIEVSFLRHSEKLIEEGKIDTAKISDAHDLITAARTYSLKNVEDPVGDNTPEKAMGVHALSLRDYALTLSEKNRGEIYFKNGKFVKKGNNFLRDSEVGETLYMAFSSDSASTAETKQMMQRLYKFIDGKLGDKPWPEEQKWLNFVEKKLGINNGESKSGPIDRKDFAKIVGGACVLTGKVATTRKLRPNVNDSDEKKDEITARALLAMNTALAFHSERRGKDEELYDGSKIEEQKTQYITMIKNARKAGVDVPNIDSDMMGGLLSGTIGLVMDKTLDYFEHIYDGVRRFVPAGKIMGLGNLSTREDLMTKLSGFAFADYALKSEEARLVNEKKAHDFIKETIIKMAAEENVDLTEASKNSEKMSIPEFDNGGADGLDEAIESHFPKSKTWKANVDKLRSSKKIVKELFDGMRDISALSDKAVLVGLDEAETQKIQTLGSKIQNILENNGEDIDFVLSRLKNSRYYQGYKKLKKLTAGGFSIGESSKEFSKMKASEAPKDNKQEEKEDITLNEKFEKLSDNQLSITRVLRLERLPSELIEKRENAVSKDLLELRRALRVFPQNIVFRKNVTIGKENVRFIQKADNRLFIQIGGQIIPLTRNAAQISDIIEEDVVANAKLYGQKYADEVISGLNVTPENQGLLVRSRNLCIKYLAGKTKKPETYFTNLSSEEVKKYADHLMKGIIKPQNVIDYVVNLEKNDYILGKESTELLEGLENNKQTNVTYTVKKNIYKKGERTWTPEQESIKAFLADLVFAEDLAKLETDAQKERDIVRKNSSKTDEETEREKLLTRGEAMVPLLEKHYSAILALVKKPEILLEMVNELPFDLDIVVDKEDKKQTTARQQLVKAIEDLKNSKAMKKINEEANKERELNLIVTKKKFTLGHAVVVKGAINSLKVKNEESEEQLTQLGQVKEAMERVSAAFAEAIQGQIKEAAEAVFAGVKGDILFDREIKDPNEENITSEEKEKRIKEGSDLLNDVVKNSISGTEGVGLFMKTILSNYFNEVSVKDKQNLLASAIRFAKPKPQILVDPEPEHKSEEAAKEYAELKAKAEKNAQGSFLGGILKGAGPLLQKVMQGMPEEALSDNPEIAEALKDMKSNLAPIPENVVKAQLANIIERSNGKIDSIEVERPLGAASVGQTFMCKMKGKELPKEGKNVVIKLLRPDVRNRMLRERNVMLKCARMTDQTVAKSRGEKIKENSKGGMELTYEGQLLRIEEELDLTIEAKNAQRGSLYDTGFSTVSAMKVDNIVSPTTNVLVLERAKGQTVDKYSEELTDKEKELLKDFFKVDKEGRLIRGEDGKLVPVGINENNAVKLNSCKAELKSMIEGLSKRQKYVCQMTESWVKEGIYGEGFYHGDLHAGNIMVDDNGLTVIDFGNATQLDEHQRKYVARMMMASAMGNAGIFMESFEELMGTDGSAEYSKKKHQLKRVFERILSLGSHKDAGTRIAAAISKAQGIGVEIPAAIYNFSQSQLRLQNTISGMNKQIEDLKNDILQIETYSGEESSLSKDSYVESLRTEKSLNGLEARIQKIRDFNKDISVDKLTDNSTEGDLEKIELEMFGESAGFLVVHNELAKQIKSIEIPQPEDSGIYKQIDDYATIFFPADTEKREQKAEELKAIVRGMTEENKEEAINSFTRQIDSLVETIDNSGALAKWNEIRRLALSKSEDRLEKISKLKPELRNVYRKKYIEENKVLKDFKDSVLREDENIKEAVNKDINSWINDSENVSEEIRKELKDNFNALREAQSDKEINESVRESLLIKFFESYTKAVAARGKKTISQRKDEFEMANPDSFVEVMGPVIDSNIKASISKLGWFNAILYNGQLRALQKEANAS